MFAGITCIFVFDILVYQARYQWNDIREISEDENSTQAEHRRRLAKTGLPPRIAVIISLAVMAYKLALALAILVMQWNTFGAPLAVCCLLVFIFAIPYEHARAANNANAVIALVPLGYPLRIAAGFVTLASVSSSNALLTTLKSNALGVFLVLGAAFAFGLAFVGITWALAGFDWHEKNGEEVCPKAHLEKLYLEIGNAGHGNENAPLAQPGNRLALWNKAMAVAILAMAAAVITSSRTNPTICIGGLLLACLAVRITMGWNRMLWFLLIITTAVCLFACIFPDLLVANSIAIARASAGYLLGACVYLIIYAWFRELNYEKMNDPLRDIREFIQRIRPAIIVAFFGKNTARLLYTEPDERIDITK